MHSSWGQDVYGEFLYFLLNLATTLKLYSKINILKVCVCGGGGGAYFSTQVTDATESDKEKKN